MGTEPPRLAQDSNWHLSLRHSGRLELRQQDRLWEEDTHPRTWSLARDGAADNFMSSHPLTSCLSKGKKNPNRCYRFWKVSLD
ncbi:uncharacterized protein LOC100451322 isoform X14 [Pongo abelii]|uniref:uncharacterized protein LOC100451322 isoform X14 n=1 Tax=Pongo abelii TaxID=9601 RepID=UPI0023E89F8C|nr:uncharacterized protein LOC100451322 isoform X14 [Pongo abelii]XP_054397815.1 uncharacterized protein LOC100451322 isoform X14 [Pongo abelii]